MGFRGEYDSPSNQVGLASSIFRFSISQRLPQQESPGILCSFVIEQNPGAESRISTHSCMRNGLSRRTIISDTLSHPHNTSVRSTIPYGRISL